jgi:hypothetical protein
MGAARNTFSTVQTDSLLSVTIASVSVACSLSWRGPQVSVGTLFFLFVMRPKTTIGRCVGAADCHEKSRFSKNTLTSRRMIPKIGIPATISSTTDCPRHLSACQRADEYSPLQGCGNDWKDPDVSDMLKPYRAESMRSYPVSPGVNNVANDDSECSAPFQIPTTQSQPSLF